jgi:hypothetical protein
MTRHTLTRLSALAIAAVLTVGCAEPGKSPLEPTARPVLAAKVEGALPKSQSDEGSMQTGAVVPSRTQATAGSFGHASLDSLSERTSGKLKGLSGYVVSSGRRGVPTTGDDKENGNNEQGNNGDGQNSADPEIEEPKEQW